LFPENLIIRKSNNYREYHKEIIEIVKVIHYAKSAGFSLKEIKKHLEVYNDGAMDDETKIGILEIKKRDLERKIEEIQFIHNMISDKISLLKNRCMDSRP